VALTRIDLERINPERVLDESDPRELVAAVEALKNWTPRSLALVDDVLTGWVADFIARPNDREGLVALQSAVHRILQSQASRAEKAMQVPDEKTAAEYARRWEGFSDSIAARCITLQERAPDRVRELMHVADIEAIIEKSGEIKQSELLHRHLDLTPSRLSQVLALMEAHRLIERRSAGRDKYIALAGAAIKKEIVFQNSQSEKPERLAKLLTFPGEAA
jgi:hypothetical protein